MAKNPLDYETPFFIFVTQMKKQFRKEIREGVFRSLIYTDNLMLAIIDFENGPWDEPEPYHSHPHEQASYVAEGEVVF